MLKLIVAVLLVAALSTGCVMTGFLVIASAKRVLAAGVPLPLSLKVTCLFWGVVGVVSDSVYNGLVGTVRFREWPRWLRWHGIPVAPELYSARIQTHATAGDQKVLSWAAILNAADPGHVELP